MQCVQLSGGVDSGMAFVCSEIINNENNRCKYNYRSLLKYSQLEIFFIQCLIPSDYLANSCPKHCQVLPINDISV